MRSVVLEQWRLTQSAVSVNLNKDPWEGRVLHPTLWSVGTSHQNNNVELLRVFQRGSAVLAEVDIPHVLGSVSEPR